MSRLQKRKRVPCSMIACLEHLNKVSELFTIPLGRFEKVPLVDEMLNVLS
jgi:hypothetical protein